VQPIYKTWNKPPLLRAQVANSFADKGRTSCGCIVLALRILFRSYPLGSQKLRFHLCCRWNNMSAMLNRRMQEMVALSRLRLSCKRGISVVAIAFVATSALAEQQAQPKQNTQFWLIAPTVDPNNFGSYDVFQTPTSRAPAGNWQLKQSSTLDDPLVLRFSTNRNTMVPLPGQQDNDCTDEDNDCAKNSGLPQRNSGKGVKGLKKPFMGLSIAVPLQ
jgi:hypothetical protein